MPLADQRTERAEQRGVGQLSVAAVGLLDALAAEDERAAQALLELADEPRLTDSGLTAEQHHDGAAGVGFTRRELEFRQLPGSTHKVTAGQPAAHVQSIP